MIQVKRKHTTLLPSLNATPKRSVESNLTSRSDSVTQRKKTESNNNSINLRDETILSISANLHV